MLNEVWVSQWPDASEGERMVCSYVVKRQVNYDIQEIGEYESFPDAVSFVDECYELGRFWGDAYDTIVTIDRRDTGVDNPEIVIDRNLFRRRY